MKKRKKRIWVLLLIIAFLILGRSLVYNHCKLDFRSEIMKYATEYKVEPFLIAAIIQTESGFRIDAISSKGATGLMQITPETENWIAHQMGEDPEKESFLVPEVNIRHGAWYMKYLLGRYDENENLALLAYNAGYGNVDKWLDQGLITGRFLEFNAIPFNESKNYLIKTRIYKWFYKYLYDWNN